MEGTALPGFNLVPDCSAVESILGFFIGLSSDIFTVVMFVGWAGCRCSVIGSGSPFADWVILLEVSFVPCKMGFR